MEKKYLRIFIIAICVSLTIFVVPRFFGYIGGIIDSLQLDLPQEYAKKSSDWLLKEMDSLNWRRADVAYSVLVDRKEKRAIPKIIENMKKDPGNASMYVQALAEIGDPNAIPSIVEVMNKQGDKTPKNKIYWESVVALAGLKYQDIWPVLVGLSESNNAGDMRVAVDGMKAFGGREAIPYLKNIKDKLEKGSYEPFTRFKDGKERNVHVI